MNENNTANKPELIIKSYKIESNRDKEGTFSVEIETSAHTLVYPRAFVTFGTSHAITFPIGIQVVNDENDVIFNYVLNLQQEQSEQTEDSETNE